MTVAPILVTGAHGLLGRMLAARCESERTAVALGHADLEISDPAAVARALERYEPAVVVNAAAMTDVDGCERDPEAAHRANVEGPRTLAAQCRAAGVRLVHVSTDFVFDGRKREPYTIEDAPNPLSVYGRTKLAGERAVAEHLADAVIARTSWVYGVGGRNFASRLFDYAARGGPLSGIVDMCSAPTYAPDLAERLLELVDLGVAGTFHVVGGGEATWFDVARTALDLAGLEAVELRPVKVADLALPAPRPAYSVMRCLLSEQLGLAHLRPWRTAMAEFVRAAGAPSGRAPSEK